MEESEKQVSVERVPLNDGLATNIGKEYRIKQCSRDSSEYGNCERCGSKCNPHYKQQWRKTGAKSNGWIDAGFGHIDCLRNGGWVNADIVDG